MNESAFPNKRIVPDTSGELGRMKEVRETGLSIREYVSIAALQGLVANGSIPMDKEVVAMVAFQYADAWLKQRSKCQP